MKDNSSGVFLVKCFILCAKGTNQSGNLKISSAQVKIQQSVGTFETKNQFFFRVLYQSLVLWDINSLWFFSLNSMYFQQKESLSRHKFGILHFDGFHLSKSYKVSAKEVQKNSLMTLKSDAKFKKNLTCGFKYDMENLVTFHPTIQKAEQLFWMDCFFPKCRRFELQIYRGVIFHDTEQWHKCE